jgi:hypothetical protein
MRHYPTSRKVACLIADEVIDYFSHYDAGVYSASNRKSARNIPGVGGGGVKHGRHLRLTSSPSSLSRLCRKCGILRLSTL